MHDLFFLIGAVYILYRNEFRSRMKFVLHSHEIERVRMVCAPDQILVRHSLKTTDFAIFNQNKVYMVLVYMVPEGNFVPEREFL